MTVITACCSSTFQWIYTDKLKMLRQDVRGKRKVNCLCVVLRDPVCFLHQLGRLPRSVSPDTCCRSSGWVPSRSQDCSRQDLILQGSRDTVCACVCVSLPGLYPDIIIKGDICVTDLFFPGKWVCIVEHNSTNLTPLLNAWATDGNHW